jgi:hypothetical protein
MNGQDRDLIGAAPDGVLRWPTPRSRAWVEAFLESAQFNPNILAVVAVGSAVRPGVSSTDVDLIVICRDLPAMHADPPMEVDLRTYSAAGIEDRLEAGHDMLGWALRFGRILFQRDEFWDRLTDAWRHRLVLPPAELARTRAANAHRHLVMVLQLGDADAAREQALSYLTHLARAELLDRGVFPASRPELAQQLRALDCVQLARCLEEILNDGPIRLSDFDRLLKVGV